MSQSKPNTLLMMAKQELVFASANGYFPVFSP